MRRRKSDKEVIERFNQLYYFMGTQSWASLFWLGHPILKCPADLFTYQEIIYEIKPSLIIETGTAFGGSALFLAMVCDRSDRGEVLSIDIEEYPCRAWHPRITYLQGSSVDPRIVEQVIKIAHGKAVMVILDSDHEYQHVKEELRIYSTIVSFGQYLIVEDTNLSTLTPGFGGGPGKAAREFMQTTDEFIVDTSREKHLLTFNPNGFLRRVK
jgi:cephalosporin hydroxylase